MLHNLLLSRKKLKNCGILPSIENTKNIKTKINEEERPQMNAPLPYSPPPTKTSNKSEALLSSIR
jgi:hypothetical protein